MKQMVEASADGVNVVLPLTPALLLRGLNCIGSASLKGASLAGSAPMIFASRGNFKRRRRRACGVCRRLSRSTARAKSRNSLRFPPDRHGPTAVVPHWPLSWAAFGTRLGPTKSRILAP